MAANKHTGIVLTGMPGCGKSTVGRFLADRLGKELIDTDDEFTRQYGITPEEYILKYGENDFRVKESRVILKVAVRTGAVIATGGGVPIKRDNYELLRMCSRVVYLHKELSELAPLSDRPLSDDVKKLTAMYNARVNIYKAHCDEIITADDIDGAVNGIIKRVLL